MKTLKTTILKTKYILLALFVAFSFSCSPEDGDLGPIGPAGVDGINGADGADGADGSDGSDGNANVQTFSYDATAFAGSWDNVAIPELTQNVLDNDLITGYLTSNGTTWVPIPCPYDSYAFSFSVHVALYVGNFVLDYGDASGSDYSITAGTLQELKVIIVESKNSGKMSDSKQQVYNELYQAGVDIRDYYAVCDYFGIAY